MMDEVVSTGSVTGRCPECDYDLRGLTEPRCPECGKAFSARDVGAYLERRWRLHKVFRTLNLATILWFIAYLFFDAIHDTTDRAETSWATVPFLAVPLHVVLAAVAAGALEGSSRRSMKRFGAGLTIIVWILILGHIVITTWTL